MSDTTVLKETLEAATAAGPIGAFGLNAKIFVAQLVNFGLVLLVLWRFAYRPIVRLLEAREEKIAHSLKQAEELEARTRAGEAERDRLLKEARLEAQGILGKTEETLEARRKEMVEKARAEVEKVVVAGKAQIASERTAMLESVRKDVVGVAILAAEKILRESVDKKTSEKLTEEALAEAGF